jgi:beta-galactosidase
MKRTLGTCYYPEHWPETMWGDDARRMADLGLTWVRIGEFAWSELEPSPGDLRFEWLDRAIETLGAQGLRVVLGTPTATPPRWMLDRHPDMLAVDADGRPRKFGSRRHYCFSHPGFFEESCRVTSLLTQRYGQNPHVAAWQTDNEYGCHDTILSYSGAAHRAFQDWCAQRYQSPDALNRAWGNVFWSMIYDDFSQIELPNLTVTEPNPAHVLAFRRFSSDQVARFNRAQVQIIRAQSNVPITHNYMGRITDFDHFKVGADLDIASWDSYPLGFLEDRAGRPEEDQRAYARQGDPDFQAFHHDLYRAVGRDGRWWVMEQQPGPVNWAPYNPAPLPGMVRLWTWEAFAHGAEAVCYFRWRQAPMAQEQMHAGLLRPDNAAAPGFAEAQQVAAEIAETPDVAAAKAQVGLIFDYEADWMWAIQPHAKGASYFDLVFDHYRALRRAGLDIDILTPDPAAVDGYSLILAPGLMHVRDDLRDALLRCDAQVLFGPRTAARDADFRIPVPLPPAFSGLDVTVTRVQSLRPDMPVPLEGAGAIRLYLEELEGQAAPLLHTQDGTPVAVQSGRISYMGGWGDDAALDRLVRLLCAQCGLRPRDLPEGLRTRRAGAERFWFNHSTSDVMIDDHRLAPAGVLRVPVAD